MDGSGNTTASTNATRPYDPNDVTTWSPEQIKAWWDFVFWFLKIEQDIKYYALAVAFMVLYDHIITLDEEAELVYNWRRWRKGFNLPNILFFANRYLIYVILGISTALLIWPDPPDSFCMVAARFSSLSGIAISMISNTGLIMRQYAFWNRNKWIGWGLGILLAVTGLIGVATGVYSFMGMKPALKFGPGLPAGCYMSPPIHVWANFIGIMFFDTVLFSVTVIRAWRLLRDSGRSLREPSPIIRHLLKTGAFYFFIVFATTSITFVSSLLNNSVLAFVMIPSNILPAVTSVICSRLLLYIRADLADAKTPHLQTKATSQWPNSPISPEVENMFRHPHLRWDDSIPGSRVGGERSGATESSGLQSSEEHQQRQTLMSLPSVVIDADDCAPSRLNHYVDSRPGSSDADVESGRRRGRGLETFGEMRDPSSSGWSHSRSHEVGEDPPGRALVRLS